MKKWTRLGTELVLDNRWLRVRRDALRSPEGYELDDFYVVEYPSYVSVLCQTQDGEIVLVEQYRNGIGQMTWECPSGMIDPGEDAFGAARRELLEETGYRADTWYHIGSLAPEPSKADVWAHLFVATEAVRVQDEVLDEQEELRVHHVKLDEFIAQAGKPPFVHAMHVALLFWALHAGLIKN
ncbi:MAG: NUDIX hydrolase [Rhodothermales bacterium]